MPRWWQGVREGCLRATEEAGRSAPGARPPPAFCRRHPSGVGPGGTPKDQWSGVTSTMSSRFLTRRSTRRSRTPLGVWLVPVDDQVSERAGSTAEAPHGVRPVSGSLSEGLHPTLLSEEVSDEVVDIMRRPVERVARRAEPAGPCQRGCCAADRLDHVARDPAAVEVTQCLGSEGVGVSHVVAEPQPRRGARIRSCAPQIRSTSPARRHQPLAPGALDE